MHSYLFALALGIGFMAGLRTFTAPAAVSWGAHVGRLALNGSPFGFIGFKGGRCCPLTLLALAEYVGDLLPKTPNRTAPRAFDCPYHLRRLLRCVPVCTGRSWVPGALLGGIGGVIGVFAGYIPARNWSKP